MTSPSAVISGGSIAGLSAAYWLRQVGWDVTVIERAPAFRDGGQNVDVRGVAHQVLDRMGLTEAVQAQNTTETGTVFVDEHGEVVAELPSEGPDAATAELEILRGDFARAILDHLPGDVTLSYDDSIEAVADHGDGVALTLASGTVLHADLLVVAEGVRSSTRDLVFGDRVTRRELGIAMAFGTIPRTAGDDDRWRWYTTTGGRQVHLRPDNHGTTRALLAYTTDDDPTGLEHDEAMARLRDVFADAGWEASRVLDGFATSDDVYVDYLTQIQLDSWHRGRVCLVGDAAWCVTPMGGGGSSLALTSGYVLAAYLSTATPTSDPGSLEAALQQYEDWMRPLVDEVQTLPSGVTNAAYPQTRLGVRLHDLLSKVITAPPLASLTSRLTQVADTDQHLPDLRPSPR